MRAVELGMTLLTFEIGKAMIPIFLSCTSMRAGSDD